MLPVRKVVLLLAAFVTIGLAAPAVRADTVVLGGTDSQNRFPFGTDPVTGPNYAPGATYQQIHNRTAFGAGPVTITQVSFASVAFGSGGPGTVNLNFNLRLGTAATTVAAPSATYSANRGADFTTAFAGALTATMTRTGAFDLVINLTTPFTYNPSGGDLLLDVVINSPTTFSNGSLYFDAGSAANSSRIFNAAVSTTGTVNVGSALLTRFEFTSGATPVPEPATVLLFGAGLAGICAAVRKRRKDRKSKEA